MSKTPKPIRRRRKLIARAKSFDSRIPLMDLLMKEPSVGGNHKFKFGMDRIRTDNLVVEIRATPEDIEKMMKGIFAPPPKGTPRMLITAIGTCTLVDGELTDVNGNPPTEENRGFIKALFSPK